MTLFSWRPPAELHKVFQQQSRIVALETENEHLQAIVSELDVTADGVPITPKTELWQAHPWANHSLSGVAHPWPCSQNWSWQRNSDKPVYSTEEVAREAELQRTS